MIDAPPDRVISSGVLGVSHAGEPNHGHAFRLRRERLRSLPGIQMHPENSNTRRGVARLSPRLLTTEEAAAYLGYRSTAVLRNIPIKPVQLAIVGVGRAPRYDIKALDAWLDQLSGTSSPSSAIRGEDDLAQAVFDEWEARYAA